MPEPLHIVCLDAPAPPDYGGAIDMYYKIKALWESGRKITLHYFRYNSQRNVDPLQPFCDAVYSYKRGSFAGSLIQGLPYTVSSRTNRQLIERLNRDDHPILLEGIHCSGILPFIRNRSRKIVIRVHNDEAEYYARLSNTEQSFLKKWYLERESRLLSAYQQVLDGSVPLACLSSNDAAVFNGKYGCAAVSFLPAFIPWHRMAMLPGKGTYCLYHGNLSISENENAVTWLINDVFSQLNVPLIIAGKNPSMRLRSLIDQSKSARLISNPSTSALDELIRQAHIHVLPSKNATGVKLKLLHALFMGRFCITNRVGVAGSGLEIVTDLAETANDFIGTIQHRMNTSFGKEEISRRAGVLDLYDNSKNASALNALL